ncbi:hypothetical protein [Roseimarinus sediminis]|uniref:hypothetical protein n=1 Tax=Roseimarinus sediminis TaxID=1610899 RepID=UPI003D20F1EA
MKALPTYQMLIVFILTGMLACSSSKRDPNADSIAVAHRNTVACKSETGLNTSQRIQIISNWLKDDYRSYFIDDTASWRTSAVLFAGEIGAVKELTSADSLDFINLFEAYQSGRYFISQMELAPREFIHYSLNNYKIFLSKMKELLSREELLLWLKLNRQNYNHYEAHYHTYTDLCYGDMSSWPDSTALYTPLAPNQLFNHLPPFCEYEMAYLNLPWYSLYLMADIHDSINWELQARQLIKEYLIACPWDSTRETSLTELFCSFQAERLQIVCSVEDKEIRKAALSKAIGEFRAKMYLLVSAENYSSWDQLHRKSFKAKKKQYKQWELSER